MTTNSMDAQDNLELLARDSMTAVEILSSSEYLWIKRAKTKQEANLLAATLRQGGNWRVRVVKVLPSREQSNTRQRDVWARTNKSSTSPVMGGARIALESLMDALNCEYEWLRLPSIERDDDGEIVR